MLLEFEEQEAVIFQEVNHSQDDLFVDESCLVNILHLLENNGEGNALNIDKLPVVMIDSGGF